MKKENKEEIDRDTLRQRQIERCETLKELVRDALRYREIKQKIDYSEGLDGMTWASLNWCVDVHSLSPATLDEAIDEILPPQ